MVNKPDRLLKEITKQIRKVGAMCADTIASEAIALEIYNLTTSIKKAEWIKACMNAGMLVANSEDLPKVVEKMRAEHQSQIAEIFEEIEKYHTDAPFHNFTVYLTEDEWQALKSRILNRGDKQEV